MAFSTAIASGALGNLQTLSLINNRIGDVGMESFSTAIASGALGSLETLYISRNQIGDEGMKAFASAIASGALGKLSQLFISEPAPALKDICLSRNTIKLFDESGRPCS